MTLAILGRRARRAFAVTTVVVVFSAVLSSATPAEARPGGKAVPAWGGMFGTTIGSGTGLSLHELQRMVGRKFEIVQRYYDWWQQFPTTRERAEVHHGQVPMIGWRSTDLGSILSGSQDGLIRARARAVKRLGHWVFMRWGWEMNGNWEGWTGVANGGSGGGPRKFKRAWRHIHDIFTSVGAWNAVWVWAPNWENVPRTPWNRFQNYYPGAKYVDWVGVDGFNWGTTQSWSRWIDIGKIVRHVYRVYHNRKPIMVAETGSVEQGGSKARWITHARYQLHENFPSVAAFVYYNGQDRSEPVDWKVTSSSNALRAFRNMGHDNYWAL